MSQRSSPTRRALLGVACVALISSLVTSCGSESKSSDAKGVSFTWAAAAVGPIDAFYREALKRVNDKYGYNGKWAEVSESEVAVGGVASDKFQISHGVTATAMAAQETQHAHLVFVGDFIKNFWTVSGKTSINSCDDLQGSKFGLNSPGGVSTALFNAWKSEKCSAGVKPDIQYIDGSDNRVQGLLAGQLDAAMLDIESTPQFNDTLHIVADIAADVPGIETNNVFVNSEFAKKNPEVVTHILESLIDVSKDVVADPSVLAGFIKSDFPDFAKDADTISGLYAKRGLIDPTGGTRIPDMKKSLALYQSAGAVGPNLDIEKSVDRSYLDTALGTQQKQPS